MQNDNTARHNNLVQPADAIEMLKPTTAGCALFRRYDETDDQAMKQGIAVELFVELELHTQLEEAVFISPSQTRPTRGARAGRSKP